VEGEGWEGAGRGAGFTVTVTPSPSGITGSQELGRVWELQEIGSSQMRSS